MNTEDPTRTKILAATRSLLASGGPERVTMRGVAERVGVSATAIYRHFSDRDALLAEIVGEDARGISAYLFPALEHGDAAGRLTATVDGYLRFAAREPALYAALMGDAGGEEMARQREALRRFLQDRVRELVPASDATDATMLVWGWLHGVATFPAGFDASASFGTLFGALRASDREDRDATAGQLTM
jgi:AcrR family transcriptional regulator